MKWLSHLRTVQHHRFLVLRHCWRVGLYWQGLTHDLSKFSPVEFCAGAKYYQGDHSPNVEERNERGYSLAWMHHKGRNKHHFEYWTDLIPGTRTYGPVQMPTRYLVEMCMDRIAACKTYRGAAYTQADPMNYLRRAKETPLMHPRTRKKLEYILTMLEEQGEEKTFRFIKEHVLQGEEFLPEDPQS